MALQMSTVSLSLSFSPPLFLISFGFFHRLPDIWPSALLSILGSDSEFNLRTTRLFWVSLEITKYSSLFLSLSRVVMITAPWTWFVLLPLCSLASANLQAFHGDYSWICLYSSALFLAFLTTFCSDCHSIDHKLFGFDFA